MTENGALLLYLFTLFLFPSVICQHINAANEFSESANVRIILQSSLSFFQLYNYEFICTYSNIFKYLYKNIKENFKFKNLPPVVYL